MTRKKELRVGLYINGDKPKACFAQLKQAKEEIEQSLGYKLEWDEMPNRQACRISTSLAPVNPEDQSNWPSQHKWLVARLNDLHRVLAKRVQMLDGNTTNDPDDLQTEPEITP